MISDELDLELLKQKGISDNVMNWNDRQTDLYEVKYLKSF
jgi:hypothetical protein